MEFDSSSSESSDDERGPRRRRKIFRLRINFNLDDFIPRFRLSRAAVQRIIDNIGPIIAHDSDRNMALSPIHQLLLALRYFAGGGFMLTIGDAHGPSKATVSRTFHRVVSAINEQYFDDEIQWPDNCQSATVKFYQLGGIPSVVGAVDGTHIPIKKPSENAHHFINRHNEPSINAMLVSGPEYKFYYVSSRWPGSVNDARVLRLSTLAQRFNDGWRPNGVPNAVLLGDSGYRLSQWLITPLLDPNDANNAEFRFNKAHRKTRQIVECAFGILKRRYACLTKLRLEPVFAGEVIKACAVLHNLSISERPIDDEEVEEFMQLVNAQEDAANHGGGDVNEDGLGIQRRAQLINSFS